jgi:sterol desaturase/sphingolipid hydroxylase (fatty acid hydroxylase superfamily)
MLAQIPVLLIALVVLSAGFGVLQWRWPSVRGQRVIRRGFFTDVGWWLFTPTVTKLFSGIFVASVILGGAALLGMSLTTGDLKGITGRETFITGWPVALQLGVFLVLADFLVYWQHRAFHTFERLWRIHAVHHSSTEIDWLSSVRLHPLNDAISSAAVATPLILLGFSPTTLAAYLPFLTLYAIALHANVNWSYGPLRSVITSPVFHRWHHTAEQEALNKNFAGLFPVFDLLFGTYYMPTDRRPQVFGVVGQPLPTGLFGQLVYPLRKPSVPSVEAAAA